MNGLKVKKTSSSKICLNKESEDLVGIFEEIQLKRERQSQMA